MRTAALTSAKGGINRLRYKGSPRPDNLYDLLNGYVTSSFSIKPRPGSVRETILPSDEESGESLTIGLTAYRGAFVVFADTAVTMTDSRFSLVVIKHPTEPNRNLSQIHFAEPFLGYLYVVAEFDDASVFHYWIQPVNAWEADTVYQAGDIITPTVPNGYSYRATRFGSPYPLWTANATRYFGDTVEPTTANGYYFVVTDVVGSNPRSGSTEPTWNAAADAITIEDVDLGDGNASVDSGTGSTTAPTDRLPPEVDDRYGNNSVTDFGAV